jgi:hypothetical protein
MEIVVVSECVNQIVARIPRSECKRSSEHSENNQASNKILHRAVRQGHLINFLFVL